MEFRTVLIDKAPATTNKMLMRCSSCGSITTSYEYKSHVTLNLSPLFCASCGLIFVNLEELSKKAFKRLEYHSS